MKGILKSVSKVDYMRYITLIAEKTRKSINPRTGRPCAHQIMIVDMDQLSYSQISDKNGRLNSLQSNNFLVSFEFKFIKQSQKLESKRRGWLRPIIRKVSAASSSSTVAKH